MRDLVVQLESRRSLHGLAESEREAQVAESIVWIRDRSSETLLRLADGSEASRLIARLRDACNDYLTAVPAPHGEHQPMRPEALEALIRLRETFRITLAYLGSEGGLSRAAELARQIPESGIGLAGPARAIILDPPFPVRLSCTGKSDYHPEHGYYEVLLFEVFNNSTPAQPVTVKSFGLEFELHLHDVWYHVEQARALTPARLELPKRLEPNDAIEGWLPAEDLPDEIEPYRDSIVKYYPFVEVAGYGKKIGVFDQG